MDRAKSNPGAHTWTYPIWFGMNCGDHKFGGTLQPGGDTFIAIFTSEARAQRYIAADPEPDAIEASAVCIEDEASLHEWLTDLKQSVWWTPLSRPRTGECKLLFTCSFLPAVHVGGGLVPQGLVWSSATRGYFAIHAVGSSIDRRWRSGQGKIVTGRFGTTIGSGARSSRTRKCGCWRNHGSRSHTPPGTSGS
jgi:hypothetical protein